MEEPKERSFTYPGEECFHCGKRNRGALDGKCKNCGTEIEEPEDNKNRFFRA